VCPGGNSHRESSILVKLTVFSRPPSRAQPCAVAPVAFPAAHWEAGEVHVQAHRHALGALADPVFPMPCRRSHASKGMMGDARIAESTGTRTGARPSSVSARAVNKNEAMAARSKSLFARKARPQYNHEGAPCLLNATAPNPAWFGGVLSGARYHRADDGFERCGLHQHDRESSHWQRPSPGECPP